MRTPFSGASPSAQALRRSRCGCEPSCFHPVSFMLQPPRGKPRAQFRPVRRLSPRVAGWAAQVKPQSMGQVVVTVVAMIFGLYTNTIIVSSATTALQAPSRAHHHPSLNRSYPTRVRPAERNQPALSPPRPSLALPPSPTEAVLTVFAGSRFEVKGGAQPARDHHDVPALPPRAAVAHAADHRVL